MLQTRSLLLLPIPGIGKEEAATLQLLTLTPAMTLPFHQLPLLLVIAM